MNRDDLASRYDAAVRKHWRSCMDHSGPTSALIGELVTIAGEHAASVITEPAGPPVLVAAATEATAAYTSNPERTTGGATAATPARSPGARTRTRTRGGAK